MKIVPADDTIVDLKKKAAENEEQAAKQRATVAALLREKAKLCREWIVALQSGKWMSVK